MFAFWWQASDHGKNILGMPFIMSCEKGVLLSNAHTWNAWELCHEIMIRSKKDQIELIWTDMYDDI